MTSAATRNKLSRRWMLGSIALVLLLIASPSVYRWYAVAQLQNSVVRSWEVYFRDTPGGDTAPEWLALPTTRILDWATKGRTDNLGDVLYYRVVSLFEGPIREVAIMDPHGFRGDVGTALSRFPRLECVILLQSDPKLPTEDEYQRLCQSLRQLPHLAELNLEGGQLTNAALAPLAGHPSLRVITLGRGSITPEVAQTLSTMPKLETVFIGWDSWATEEQEAFRARLPKVKVVF